MVKLVLILLSIQIAASAVLTKSVVSRNGFNYIGSFRPQSSVQSRSTQSYDESNYYMSQNWGAWNSADKDCSVLLGDNATLVAIESLEEWNFLKKLLQDYGFAHDYWTSGLWDASSSRWRWLASNTQLETFAPWAAGQPSNPNSLLRVLINYRNAFDASWRTVSYTQLHRYICEVKAPSTSMPPPQPTFPPTIQPTSHPNSQPSPQPTLEPYPLPPVSCSKSKDLAIVLDLGTIGSYHLQPKLQLVERLASAFTYCRENRLSFITNSIHAPILINLTNTLSAGEISSTIMSTEWEDGAANAAYGIELGMLHLITNSRDVPMNIVVFTDAKFESLASTIASANGAGIRTFVVQIAEHYPINFDELIVEVCWGYKKL